MQIPILNGLFDELEKIAALGEAMPGGGRAAVMQQAAGTAKRVLSPQVNDTGKAWMSRQMRPGGALTSPATSASRLATRTAPVATMASRAAGAVRGARVF